jgi:hypothetical protein
MAWLSVDGMTEWFDKMGRDFNRAMKGDALEREKAGKTGMVSLRDGTCDQRLYIFSSATIHPTQTAMR